MIASLPNELWWKVIDHAISFRSNLGMVEPSLDRLHPFCPGRFPGFDDQDFYSSQMDIWKRSNMVARKFVQVNRLWRGIAERFLYSAFYFDDFDEEWRVQRFIDTVKLNPNLAKLLRTLVIMPRARIQRGGEFFGPLEQVLGLCHGINAIVMKPLTSPLPFFHFPNFSRRLRLISAIHLSNKDFHTFMINFNNYTNLQVLEISVSSGSGNGHMLSSFPEHITFPSLHTLVLRTLNRFARKVVRKWELPSLKALYTSQWGPDEAPSHPILSLYEKVEFADVPVGLLHDLAFYHLIRAPPVHLTNVTLSIEFEDESPPTHPAIKLFFSRVVTLGIRNFYLLRLENQLPWVQFFADPTYIPHLRLVSVDMQASVLGVLLRFEKTIEDRGVVFKGMADDDSDSSFVPVKFPQRDTLEVSMPLLSNESMLILSPALKCPP